jgi:hypothetical protein
MDTLNSPEGQQFVDDVREVLGLLMSLPEHAVVLCVDEKDWHPSAQSRSAATADTRQPSRSRTDPRRGSDVGVEHEPIGGKGLQ